ncbi:hypothetical protein Tco_0248403 [Tanacetum coccineum]
MKEQAYNVDRDKDHKSLTTKAISLISRIEIVYPCYKGGVSDFSHEETVVFSELEGAAISYLFLPSLAIVSLISLVRNFNIFSLCSAAGKLPALDEYKVVLDVQRSITDAYKATVYIATLRRHSIVVDKDINEVLLFLSGSVSDGGRMRVAVADNLNVDVHTPELSSGTIL